MFDGIHPPTSQLEEVPTTLQNHMWSSWDIDGVLTIAIISLLPRLILYSFETILITVDLLHVGLRNQWRKLED